MSLMHAGNGLLKNANPHHPCVVTVVSGFDSLNTVKRKNVYT